MKTIYKYPIPIDDHFSVRMPADAQVLCVNTQQGEPFIWALVNPDAVQVDHWFLLRGTGHPADGIDAARYVGTFFIHGGAFVFHLFEEAVE